MHDALMASSTRERKRAPKVARTTKRDSGEAARGTKVVAAWRRVRAWLAAEFPEGYALLAPGATKQQLARLEATLGRRLPPDWSQLLAENNGQSVEDEPGLFGGWTFLSTEMAAREWQTWQAIRAEAPPSLMYSASYSSEPEEAIEELYSDGGWLPVAKEPMESNYLGLDFSPGPKGTPGQVINFGRDEDDKRVLMPGLGSLVEWLAARCEAGEISVDRTGEPARLWCRGGRLPTALADAAG